MRIILMSLFLMTSLASAGEVQIPISIINQYFDTNQDGILDKTAFNIKELETVFQQIEPLDDFIIKEITNKYLEICYPKGETNILDIINSTLPAASKKIILAANPESVLLKAALNDLWHIPINYLNLIKQVTVKSGDIEIETLIQECKKYTHNLHYSTYISIQDAHKRDYLLSTPSANHLVSEIMDKTKGTALHLSFTPEQCQNKKCITEKSDGFFASFKFSRMAYLRKKENITTTCYYEGIYRREYLNATEVEIAFSNCRLQTTHPLIKRMYPDE